MRFTRGSRLIQGLDQDFNSLDAQYEASSAYIRSQAHAGWSLMRSTYDDGGYSGGSTDRPNLQRLLADVRARKIDVIVVYKVDRLTRSLADFADDISAQRAEIGDHHAREMAAKRPSCLQVLISRFRRTGWWAHQGSNLGPAD